MVKPTLGWKLKLVDVKTVFLESDIIDTEIYVRLRSEFHERKMWRLKKCVWNLNDAARAWYIILQELLLRKWMCVYSVNPALFNYCDEGESAGFMCVYVDDILYTGNDNFHGKVEKQMIRTIKKGPEDEIGFKCVGVDVDKRNS